MNTMQKKFFLIVINTFLSLGLFAQLSSLDSLKSLIDQAPNDSTRILRTITYANELTYNKPAEAKTLLDDCINDSKKIGFQKGIASALYVKAISFALEGQFENSLKNMIDASTIYQEIGNRIGYAKCIGGQGNIFYFMDDMANAQKYYEEAYKIYKEEKSDVGMASCIGNLGLICHQSKQFEKALKYQLEGLKLEEKAGNKRGIAISHISISSVLLDLKRFSEAKKHALTSIKYAKEIADTNATSDAMIRLAECYRLTQQFDSAQFYLNESIRIAEKIKDYHQLSYALQIQTDLYDSLGFYFNAFKTQKRLMVVKDSLLNKEKTAQMVEMQTKFESEKKEKENIILIAKNANQKLILWGLIIIIAFTFVFVFYILFSRRKLSISHEKLITLHQEVQQQKEEIMTQAEDLIRANEAIIAQKDQIESTHHKISDSIIYASFIQSAMLPTEEQLTEVFTENFVLYKPRDVVSGDFYWLKEKNGSYLIAVADCTGHGVPGALLSMMGISFLNDIVANSSEIRVSTILEYLRQNVKQALGQFSNRSLRKEGMEIGLISFNPNQNTISFSGAYLSLWLVRDGVIKEIKSDRMPIGISLKEKPFTSTEFNVKKGDIIYMFTDGIADQLGGKNAKKFLRRNFLNLLVSISNLPLSEQKNKIEQNHLEWKGDRFDQIDDILVLGIRV